MTTTKKAIATYAAIKAITFVRDYVKQNSAGLKSEKSATFTNTPQRLKTVVLNRAV